MHNTEDIIKGLKCLIKLQKDRNIMVFCEICPYNSEEYCTPIIAKDTLALLKEQDETIKELQNAYGYLQKQFFKAQDKLLKEQERKKGNWDYGTQCLVCKGTIIPPKGRKVRVNFCPWCGADMRGWCDE